ncbi:MAG TPA: carboxyl transferase domain-containing protein, partial [Gammaproteobacteria bacterium]
MPKLQTKVDPGGAEFRRNAATNRSLAEQLRRTLDEVEAGGSEEARARHLERDKLPVRTRVAKLLDPGTPWLEIGKLAAHGVYDVPLPAAGLVCGVGTVRGVRCMVV